MRSALSSAANPRGAVPAQPIARRMRGYLELDWRSCLHAGTSGSHCAGRDTRHHTSGVALRLIRRCEPQVV